MELGWDAVAIQRTEHFQMSAPRSDCLFAPRTPVAILGVPFDVVSSHEAIALIERMIVSRQPHYVVTPNMDFLVQAAEDVELRRILVDAHLVVCDGTPLVWASRLLGNPLPERVAGADLVPVLISRAAKEKYRLFLLGATETSSNRAVERLAEEYPDLIIAGHYSPPFNDLLEMDHEQIKQQISASGADILLVSFGCPKQEKWISMHYRTIGVPVTIGVGGTIDFLAGQLKRAPVWMQKTGTEWLFRLAQEPRRLFRRYRRDIWVFSQGFLAQWWRLNPGFTSVIQRRFCRSKMKKAPVPEPLAQQDVNGNYYRTCLPDRLDAFAMRHSSWASSELVKADRHCLLDASFVRFVDSTGVGFLIQWHKRACAAGRCLVLVAPSTTLQRALSLLRLTDFFLLADSLSQAVGLVDRRLNEPLVTSLAGPAEAKNFSKESCVQWYGEITAANADRIGEETLSRFLSCAPAEEWQIDMSQVRFIDSSGLGLMLRLKKQAIKNDRSLAFTGVQPGVHNVLKLAGLVEFLLCGPPRRDGDAKQLFSGITDERPCSGVPSLECGGRAKRDTAFRERGDE